MSYFNIPEIGELFIEKILIEVDIPIFMICTDNKRKRYAALCIEDDVVEKYLIVRTDAMQIIKMVKQKISMRELFLDDLQKAV